MKLHHCVRTEEDQTQLERYSPALAEMADIYSSGAYTYVKCLRFVDYTGKKR